MDRQQQLRQAEALRLLHDVSRAINNENDFGALLNLIMDSVNRLTKAERGFLVLRGTDEGLDVKVARKLNRRTIDDPGFKVSRGIIEETIRTAQPVIVDNAKMDPDFARRASIMTNKPVSVASLPLKLRGKVIGAIYLDSRIRAGLFTADMMMILEMFADTAATAIHNALLRRKAGGGN